MKTNDAKYYESYKANASDTQGDPTSDLETVTHTGNGNEKVTHASNRNFEQKLLSNQTIPVVIPRMNPRTDQRIAPIVVTPQTLLTTVTKEVVADALSGSVWFHRNPR